MGFDNKMRRGVRATRRASRWVLGDEFMVYVDMDILTCVCIRCITRAGSVLSRRHSPHLL